MVNLFSFTWARNALPKRLFARTVLILIVPIIGVQIVLAAVFIQRHFEGVTRQMTNVAGAELNFVIEALQNGEDVRAIGRRLTLGIVLIPDAEITPGNRLNPIDVSGRELVNSLNNLVLYPLFVDTVSVNKAVRVAVQLPDAVLEVTIPRNRLMASNPHLLFTWMFFTSAVFLVISLLFLRNQVRPIRDLARAAEAFGKGRSLPFRPRGADEVRRAGSAFLSMRERIERQIDSRTTMLSSVSHDLRTPLTRMRLALDMAEATPETNELKQDVREMERMIEGFLTFARGEAEEETTETDAITLIRELAQNTRRQGGKLSTVFLNDTPERTEVSIRAMAVRRALQNLLSNAHRHGSQIRMTLRLSNTSFDVEIEDNGPGIPPSERETALRPFTRLDPARNQDAGGSVGLGLSIASDVARAHGGILTLGDSDELGGLKVLFRLPR